MGVRTRPGIKHDHGHNQQREALAEQHRDGTGAVLHRGENAPGAAPAASPLPSGRNGGMDWPLSLDGCRALASARGYSFLQDAGLWDPSGSPSPLGLGSVCPWCHGYAGLWCSAPWEHPKLWLFLYFVFVFFAFLAANLPLQVLWRKQDCVQGAAALPAPPHRGQSRGAALGKGLWAGARPRSPCLVKSLCWSQQFGVLDPVPPS